MSSENSVREPLTRAAPLKGFSALSEVLDLNGMPGDRHVQLKYYGQEEKKK